MTNKFEIVVRIPGIGPQNTAQFAKKIREFLAKDLSEFSVDAIIGCANCNDTKDDLTFEHKGDIWLCSKCFQFDNITIAKDYTANEMKADRIFIAHLVFGAWKIRVSHLLSCECAICSVFQLVRE